MTPVLLLKFFFSLAFQDKRLKVVAIKLHSLLMCINKLKFEEGSKKEMAESGSTRNKWIHYIQIKSIWSEKQWN